MSHSLSCVLSHQYTPGKLFRKAVTLAPGVALISVIHCSRYREGSFVAQLCRFTPDLVVQNDVRGTGNCKRAACRLTVMGTTPNWLAISCSFMVGSSQSSRSLASHTGP